jgi:hypothetical protein
MTLSPYTPAWQFPAASTITRRTSSFSMFLTPTYYHTFLALELIAIKRLSLMQLKIY